MNPVYYIIENNERKGPFLKEELHTKGITDQTMVWREGLSDWVKAEELDELADLFLSAESAFGTYAETVDEPYFAIINGVQTGPCTISELIAKGLNQETFVWRNGMGDWMKASTRPDIMAEINANCPPAPEITNPYYGAGVKQTQQTQQPAHPAYQQPQYTQPSYQQQPYQPAQPSYQHPFQQPFQQPQYPRIHTNWLPWAILGTVLGLCSCIGMIFGIIGIVNANKANTCYMMHDEVNGDIANSSAKSMTLVSLILGGIGMILSVIGGLTGMLGI